MKPGSLLFCLFVVLCSPLLAQQYAQGDNMITQRIETLIKRYGQPARIYPTNAARGLFDLAAGENFVVVFQYDGKSKAKRRMLVHQLGPKGEKLKLFYAGLANSYRNGPYQLFEIRGTAPTDEGSPITYRIDADKDAVIYIYKYTRGVM
ncbi:MAG TPA: hypothetical protein PKD90_18215 [Phnomibacter sp.]|nr:hypothetical protein [Phnomibacter sp.]